MFKKVFFVVLLGNSLLFSNSAQAQGDNNREQRRPEIYYIIHSKLAGDIEVLKKTLPAHLAHLKNLQNRDVLFAAGPTLCLLTR